VDLIVKAGFRQTYVGYSWEEKPTDGVTPGTRLEEVDTGDEYIFEGSGYSSTGQNLGGGTWHRLAGTTQAVVRLLERNNDLLERLLLEQRATRIGTEHILDDEYKLIAEAKEEG
jgi:hypothetical protein